MKNIQSLLQEINEIRIHHEAMIEATGGRFNIFKIVGVNHYENTHSAIIAELLNPNGTHGLKSKLLECFIESFNEKFTIQSFNFDQARVSTEHVTEEGRLDILIEDIDKKAIIIENKLYASDQAEQLKRYDKYARTYQNGYQILYLTLSGKNATDQSGEGVNYLPISYKVDIIKWLEKCVSIAARFPLLRETLFQYINHLKNLTDTDMDTILNEQIVKNLINNEKNFKSAIAISKGLDDAKCQIFNNFVNTISKNVKLERMKLPNQGINEFGFIYNNYYLYFGKDGVKTYVSIKTRKSLDCQETFSSEDKMVFFHKKPDCCNPFGYSLLNKEH
ncbi:MAG: PD-(D/E)XK nuclease family protein, partial [Candidatus Cloacimonetes bacterium]|nr:PD-(D/E)XK nuclease family protein [Candidatus Cloacimonadota bacterium]